ncbi:MAG: MFS transporter [Akkermansiaceae bacterium]|nr:MFS transporter [Akkermansiaceae bacterium]MCH1508459.1 MFS transporter [Akkermansiaceae bacterium]
MSNEKPSKALFWGCFIALITTAFGFITRMFLLDDPTITQDLLGLDEAEVGMFKGIQVWPFAISIILFSLIIDKVGYKFAMIFAAASQIIWGIMGIYGLSVADTNPELAKDLLFWGGLILALGNGTVEAFINPVVATMYDKEKTKWLNILHAGWPGGLVIAGIAVILMGGFSWEAKLGLIFIPAIIYLVMLIRCQFPVQERVAAGVSYRDMLGEFGFGGAAVVAFLMFLQLDNDFPNNRAAFGILCGGSAVALGVYTKSLGRPLMFVLILLMTPLATTEIGTDGWISGIMANAVTFHAGWILVYTSVIMMVLRFYAGPIVHRLQPLPLLILSCVLAIAGLFALSGVSGVGLIFAAATLYALGKTFFWPTMLGIVSEQTPKGGALTLNSVSGIGMLAVGVLGFPYIGSLQEKKAISEIVALEEAKSVPGLVSDGGVSSDFLEDKEMYLGTIEYQSLKGDDVDKLLENQDEEIKKAVSGARDGSAQKALANMAIFPLIMLITYVLLYLYFKSKGGYKPLDVADGAH